MAIGRRDLESKLREIESAVGETRDAAKNIGIVVAVGVVVVIAAAFLFGRRKGTKSERTLVEVYRVRG